MATTDPYSAPRSRVADVPAPTEGNFTFDGEAVPAGRGWQWIVAGWRLFTRQPGIWVVLLVVWLLISVIIGLIPILGGLVNSVLWPVFAGGIMLGCRALDAGGDLSVGHLFAGFRDHFGRLVVIGLLELVALVALVLAAVWISGVGLGVLSGAEAGAAVSGREGLLAVLIALALLVPVLMAAWFTPALVAVNDLGIGDAIKASFLACLKNIVPFLVYGLIGFGIGILATIPLGIGFALAAQLGLGPAMTVALAILLVLGGWLVLGATLAASVYAAYRDIFYTG
jgi:hypothetical protein